MENNQELKEIKESIDKLQKGQADLTEIVIYLKDNMATKDDVIALEARVSTIENNMATKDDLRALEARMATKDDLKAQETRMVSKAYLDDKLADQTAEIFDRIYRQETKDKAFKRELINIFDNHSFCTSSELDRLKELT